jgi:hypothetical protein
LPPSFPSSLSSTRSRDSASATQPRAEPPPNKRMQVTWHSAFQLIRGTSKLNLGAPTAVGYLCHVAERTIGLRRGWKTGKIYPHIEPSRKALKYIGSEIKQLTTERYSPIPTEAVIRNVNEVARWWVGYFRYRNCTKALSYLKRYLVYRIRVYLRRKHGYHSFGYKAYPDRYYFDSLGVYEVSTMAPWTQRAKASG